MSLKMWKKLIDFYWIIMVFIVIENQNIADYILLSIFHFWILVWIIVVSYNMRSWLRSFEIPEFKNDLQLFPGLDRTKWKKI